MPRPGNLTRKVSQVLTIPGMPWLNDALGGGIHRGGIYSFSGDPGVGKSTLLVQSLGNLALSGVKVLYVTNEQSLAEIEGLLSRLFADGEGRLPAEIVENFFIEDGVREVDELPRFLARRILPIGSEYQGVEVMVYDSVQGRGLPAGATQKFRELYAFTEQAKLNGLAVFLVAHVNKTGQVAGPNTLLHNADTVINMKRAAKLRPLFVPKNRFGASVLEPVQLMMEGGRLVKSPQSTSKSSSVLGFSGLGRSFAEVQASVGLPQYGSQARTNAPSLPRAKVSQIVKVLAQLPDVDFSEMSYEPSAYLPECSSYKVELDLALAVSLLSSFLQRPVPSSWVFVGELDLLRRVRVPDQKYLSRLGEVAIAKRNEIERIYMADEQADMFREADLNSFYLSSRPKVQVWGVRDLDGLLPALWPDLFEPTPGSFCPRLVQGAGCVERYQPIATIERYGEDEPQ